MATKELFKFPEYEQHPVALALMPGGMDDAEFEALCADVGERGVIMPVTLYEGKVLDGWHRYRAARHQHCNFDTIKYEGKDPAGYITSVNVLRRKLSSLQRALVGARLHLHHALTQRVVCKKLGISNEVVNLVLKALDSKNTRLIKRIETDSDFTRGSLREELVDLGIIDPAGANRQKAEPVVPPGPNSVFALGGSALSAAAAGAGIEHLLSGADDPEDPAEPGDTDGIKGTGLAKSKTAQRKPKDTAAQLLADQFKALMSDEKDTFLTMIWPEAKARVASLFPPPVAKKVKVAK